MEADVTTFDDRERAFENRYVHDEAMRFRARARRTRAVAAWANGLMRKDGAVALAYADDIVASEVSGADEAALADRIAGDLARSGHAVTAADVRAELDRHWTLALEHEREG